MKALLRWLFGRNANVGRVAEGLACARIPGDVDEDGGRLTVLGHDGMQLVVGREVHALSELLARLFDAHQFRTGHIRSVQACLRTSVRRSVWERNHVHHLMLVLREFLKDYGKVPFDFGPTHMRGLA